MATVAITNGHNVVVAVSFETGANPVHISSRISYVFLRENQELISATKWCKGALNLRGLLVLTVVKRRYALFTI